MMLYIVTDTNYTFFFIQLLDCRCLSHDVLGIFLLKVEDNCRCFCLFMIRFNFAAKLLIHLMADSLGDLSTLLLIPNM
jgi:hypothetical protein